MLDPNKPRLPMIAKLDETANWELPVWIKKYIKRIFGVYVFDRSVGHYLCELAPSAELHFVKSDYEVTDAYWLTPNLLDLRAQEKIADYFAEGNVAINPDPVTYVHLSNIDAMSRIAKGEYPPEGKSGIIELDPVTASEAELSTGDMFRLPIEYIRGNSI